MENIFDGWSVSFTKHCIAFKISPRQISRYTVVKSHLQQCAIISCTKFYPTPHQRGRYGTGYATNVISCILPAVATINFR